VARTHCIDMLQRLARYPHLHRSRSHLLNTAKHLSTSPHLPHRLWPALETASLWANTLRPTAFWTASTALPAPWLQLTITPATSSDADCQSESWTQQELNTVPSPHSLAFSDSHFYIIHPSITVLQQLTSSLITQLATHLTAERNSPYLHPSTPQLLPRTTPTATTTPIPSPTTHKRVSFATDTPRFIHPALRPPPRSFHPPSPSRNAPEPPTISHPLLLLPPSPPPPNFMSLRRNYTTWTTL
jgi:hypothetical protein